MGCSVSCSVFETLSTAIQWLAAKRLNIVAMIHILDDFLLGASSWQQCHNQLKQFLSLCAMLGIPMAPEKTFGPDTTMVFAGIEIDTVQSELRLPLDKLQKCEQLVRESLKRKKMTLKELQSLIGTLNFACYVVVPGRAFLRRLIDLTRGIKKEWHRIRLDKEARADLAAWQQFLVHFNGKKYFLESEWINDSWLSLETDASGSVGYGAVFGNHYLQGRWPDSWRSLNITILELFPIVVALHIWGPRICNKKIIIHTDNMALVHILNKTSSRDAQVMVLVRSFVLACMTHNILCKFRHVPGCFNTVPDFLSRSYDLQKLRDLAPHLDTEPTAIPVSLLPDNWDLV